MKRYKNKIRFSLYVNESPVAKNDYYKSIREIIINAGYSMYGNWLISYRFGNYGGDDMG